MSEIVRRRPRTPANVPARGPVDASEGPREVIRLARVRAARERIQSGYYERREVKSSLARALLAALRDQ